MSHSDNAGFSWNELLDFPYDIRMYVLGRFIDPEYLEVEDVTPPAQSDSSAPSPQHLLVKYSCGTDGVAGTLPADLRAKYWNLRVVSWLKTWKYFSSPYNFVMSHHILAAEPQVKIPAIKQQPTHLLWLQPNDDEAEGSSASFQQPLCSVESLTCPDHPRYTDHGLEKVILEFDATEYYELFGVTVPPFDKSENQVQNPLMRGAASMLEHCRELKLVFGKSFRAANPWCILNDDQWNDAKAGANVCEAGNVVDWLLEYAWHNNYIQHIKSLKLEGVQPWVREKWDDIFQRWIIAQQLGNLDWMLIHAPNIKGLEMLGMEPGQEWCPQDHYPPSCSCTIPCSELKPFVHAWRTPQFNTWEDYKEVKGNPARWENMEAEDDTTAWETNGREEEDLVREDDPTVNEWEFTVTDEEETINF